MAKELATLAILGLILFEQCVCTCLNAKTSEGLVNLLEGQTACAPLLETETVADVGKRFVSCSNDHLYLFHCPATLRYNTLTGICNWPNLATCQPNAEKLVPLECNPRSRSNLPNGTCSDANCKLPNCFCFGSRPLLVDDLPMFVMVSFNGPVSRYWSNEYYEPLAVNNTFNLFNPDGCKQRFSFYVNPVDTDFSTVKLLLEGGNEIGLNTPLPSVDELIRIKNHIFRETGDRCLVHSIKGYRAPNFNVPGDAQFDILNDCSFDHDTSILGTDFLFAIQPQWPFTLDFPVEGCLNPPCPTKQYPGLWEVPVNHLVGDDNETCNSTDSCSVGTSRWRASEQQWQDLFKRNFQRMYLTKVPMTIPISSTLFQNYPNAYNGLARFLLEVQRSRQDVWLVTPRQVISWIQSQQSNSAMKQQKWGC